MMPLEKTEAGRRPSTEKDVARLAGVSVATVSRVINGARNVTPSTRTRVSIAISQLRYSPNDTAAALARRGSGISRMRGVSAAASSRTERSLAAEKEALVGDEDH